MKKLSVREVAHLGAGCLVKTDQGWQRAVVIKCSQKSGSNVRLIDTGENRKMPVDCVSFISLDRFKDSSIKKEFFFFI